MSSNIPDDVDDDLFLKKRSQNYIFDKKTKDRLLNSRALVQESEQIAQSTLEQLSSQRETLERVEDDLDNINFMTRSTQKHLNNMKSIWGWVRGSFSSTPAPIAPITSSGGPSGSGRIPRSVSSGGLSLPANSQTAQNTTPRLPRLATNADDELEEDLSELGYGLGRLKEMASKLGDEIEDHNEIIDRITSKSERAGDSIKIQNRQMNQLLKKG